MVRLIAAAAFLALLPATNARGDDAEIAKALKERGATVRETNGTVTSLDAADCSKWTDDDYRQVARLAHLKSLSLGQGLNDQNLELLTGLQELETFQTNLSQVTDDGMKLYARLKGLKNLKLFHPGKAFTGTGLAHLTELAGFERLTVAGSLGFGDEGMAAVGKLVNLKEFRTWHAGQTLEGVKHLKNLKSLKQLTLGQRLAYKPPTTLSDETIPVLVELKALESLQLEEARLKPDSLLLLRNLPALKTLILQGIDLPEGDVERIRQTMQGVDVKWTKPNDVYMKRIHALFGEK